MMLRVGALHGAWGIAWYASRANSIVDEVLLQLPCVYLKYHRSMFRAPVSTSKPQNFYTTLGFGCLCSSPRHGKRLAQKTVTRHTGFEQLPPRVHPAHPDRRTHPTHPSLPYLSVGSFLILRSFCHPLYVAYDNPISRRVLKYT